MQHVRRCSKPVTQSTQGVASLCLYCLMCCAQAILKMACCTHFGWEIDIQISFLSSFALWNGHLWNGHSFSPIGET